jgi:hypothetical protein
MCSSISLSLSSLILLGTSHDYESIEFYFVFLGGGGEIKIMMERRSEIKGRLLYSFQQSKLICMLV